VSDVKKSELDRKHHDVEASKKEGHGGKDGS